MGKHAWVTGRGSGSAYAARFSRLSDGREEAAPGRADGGGPADLGDSTEPGDVPSGRHDEPESSPIPRTRWRLPAAASCLVLGAVLSVVLVLSFSGHFGAPNRAVTVVETGGSNAAALQNNTLESGQPPPQRADLTEPAGPTQRAEEPVQSKEPFHSETLADGIDEETVAVVHVAGAVKNPGIVTLRPGSRVHEAVAAAGGAAPDARLSVVNLAALIQDGQQLYVPTGEEVEQGNYAAGAAPGWIPGAGAEAGSGTGTGAAAGAAAGAPPSGVSVLGSNAGMASPVNVNSASIEELSTLPGVGPVLSQRIVDWRNAHGAFRTVEEMDAVAGIGPKMMQSLRDLVTF